ncbi:MAG TPA: nucleotide exchange factor GrpE [Chitinophagaceae bacterium]
MEKEIMGNTGQPDGNNIYDQEAEFDNPTGLDDSGAGGETATDEAQKEIEKLKNEAGEFKEKYLRQVAEFDNFRKRTNREKLELIQTAGKDVIVSLLDILDDCDRAQQQLDKEEVPASAKEGILLVFNKLRSSLYARGVKPMVSIGEEFNPDLHEAVTEVPVPPDMKGKVVDELQRGYYLNDKIIRFAKVVVGK